MTVKEVFNVHFLKVTEISVLPSILVVKKDRKSELAITVFSRRKEIAIVASLITSKITCFFYLQKRNMLLMFLKYYFV